MTDRAARAIPRLHVVTDDAILERSDFSNAAARILDAGGASLAFHLRGPHTGGAHLYRRATELMPLAEAAGALLVINDRVDVALASGLSAVHLGGRSLAAPVVRELLSARPPFRDRAIGPSADGPIVGVSVHSVAEAAAAWSAGADYVMAGNAFEPPSHAGRAGLGVDRLAEVVRAASGSPTVAIGGITPSVLPSLRGVGVYGVAVIRGVWSAADPAEAVREYISGLVTDRNNGVQV